ncbi:hypothetical protein M378DRAFT_19111 [Amanita muscaria Koide BX008]|uniref:Uncharacterized protein n=1 Tax=Amanita muscaria (strain Koide BX008) TaxID=946122 RepID=A0A0C2VZE6_AMAMK|nr:hypothetical protein M378DRAFT_19111 [Amanita muscaria Koide BX008]
MALPTRWSNESPQGTAFHEIVVLPTLAPQLAREYHFPGTPEHAQAALYAQAESLSADYHDSGNPAVEPVIDHVEPAVNDNISTVNDLTFYVLVIVEWTERAAKGGRNPRPKKVSESKNTPSSVEVLKISRSEFITAALSAHNYHKLYIPGPTAGPNMRVSWTGSPGGRTQAPVIEDDKDWKNLQDQLRAAVSRPRCKTNTVCVMFDLDSMDGYKNRKRALSPHLLHDRDSELDIGTHVPRIDAFSADQVALGRVIANIKAAWPCDEHSACFITKDSEHIVLNRFRLNAWGSAIIAGKCLPHQPPPDELVESWLGVKAAVATRVTKPRGHSGPYPMYSSDIRTAPEADSPSNLILTTMLAMLAQNMNQNRSSKSKVPTPPSSPICPSSPPPLLADELDKFLDAFGKAKNIPNEIISAAGVHLRSAHYMPDVIFESSVSVDRLRELTGFAEGEVHALKKFAREWSGKIAAKRAKHRN